MRSALGVIVLSAFIATQFVGHEVAWLGLLLFGALCAAVLAQTKFTS